MPIVLNKDFWNGLGEKLRKCKYALYIGLYLSVCILIGDKYVFTATVTFTT